MTTMATAQSQGGSAQSTFYEASALLFLYTETPLHAGTGASLGIVDLPIQREVHTQYPMIQGSSIKGALRSRAEQSGMSRERLRAIFGPDGKDGVEASDHAGSLIVGDARTLLFPVRSLEGVFHYVTSADALARFARDCQRAGITGLDDTLKALPAPSSEAALLTKDGAGQLVTSVSGKKQITLEEFTFVVETSDKLQTIAAWLAQHALPTDEAYTYWRQQMQQRLVVLPETDFRDFTLYATQVVQRIRLDSTTKTVEDGGLWSEESLPSDTLLYAPVFATHPRQGNGNGANGANLEDGAAVLTAVASLVSANNSYIQLGGDETVGYGQVAARL